MPNTDSSPSDDYPRHKQNPVKDRIKLWIVGVAVTFFVLGLLFPSTGYDRNKARSSSCLSNLKQQALGVLMYAQDYDMTLPPTRGWMDELHPYLKNDKIYQCPTVAADVGRNVGSVYGYAYYSRLSDLPLADVTDQLNTVSTYDSTSRLRNRTDPFTSVPIPGRHNDGSNISFLDGHAKHINDGKIGHLQEQMKSLKLNNKRFPVSTGSAN